MKSRVRILLNYMPFANPDKPAIGLSLLKAICQASGYACDIQYGNLFLVEAIGPESYRKFLQGSENDAYGDWLFSEALYGDKAVGVDEFLASLEKSGTSIIADMKELLNACRKKVEPFLDFLMGRIAWSVYDIVGFSCSLQQNIASLAYASKIKENFPDITLVFGGANFEAPMGNELMKMFPFIDIAVSGEADHVFPLIVRKLRDRDSLEGIDGVFYRQKERIVSPQNPIARIQNLDYLPYPDYDDYYRARRLTGLDKKIPSMLLMETSRGCWWGEKTQCTFCGLNNLGMKFRSKSPDRVLQELDCLSEKYNTPFFHFCDCNLDRSYLKSLLPRLRERNTNWKIYDHEGNLRQLPYRENGKISEMMCIEVKANFTKEQIRLLADAGIILFPGIESLSTPLLRLVRKGCSAPQNIQVLKWCTEFGLTVLWNFLYGFPGEDPMEYRKMRAMIPKLVHLPPPSSFHRIILTRSSPYQCFPEYYGLENMKPATIYRLLYPFPEENLMHMAYYFDFDYSDGRDVDNYIADLRNDVENLWRGRNQIGSLHYFDDGEVLRIIDKRSVSVIPHTELKGIEREVYLFCDTFRRRNQLKQFILDMGGSPDKMDNFLNTMVGQSLMLEIDDGYLSLAITPQRKNLTPEKINRLMNEIYPRRRSPNMVTA